MDSGQESAIRAAESMRVFAGADKEIRFGDWRAWVDACITEGRTIPPEEFKAKTRQQRQGEPSDRG
jgi:hypothetical protein